MSAAIYLRTLGSTELETVEGTATLSCREAALLALLCSKRNCRATRREIADLFWPTVRSSRARHSLSQLIYALRSRLPPNVLLASGESLAITGCQADFIELVRDFKAGHAASAIKRYRGRFLPTGELGSDELRDWRDQVEMEAAEAVGHALLEQSYLCGSAELEELIDVGRELLSTHPELRPAQIALLEAHARLGQVHQVERLHKVFVQNPASTPVPPVASFLSPRATPHQIRTIRFAGRETELQVLQRCWEEVKAGTGGVVVIQGEPGIGKTRLADHFLRRVAIRGGTTWIARCCAATQRLPYSVVSEFIRENVTDSSTNETLAILHPLSSATSRSTPDIPSDERRHQLTEKLTTLVLSKCSTQQMVIFVDDAQWADDYTALLLSYWSYRLRSEKVLILLSVRTEEAEPPPDWIFADLGRVTRIPLGRISVEAAAEIVSAFESSSGTRIDKELRDAVLWQSGGRPFLLLEALSSLTAEDSPVSATAEAVLTESAESVLRRRFRNLTNEASWVLGALAVWGQEISGDVLSRIAGLGEEPFVAALDLLQSRGIAYWHRGSVAFPHDLMREAAYRNLMPATRALFHRRAAEEIKQVVGAEGLIAQHYARGGESILAAMHALQAASKALTDHLYTDYEYYCKLCIEHGSQKQQTVAAAKLSSYLVRLGRTSEIQSISHLLQDDSPDHKLLLAISELEHKLATGECEVSALLERSQTIVAMADSLDELTAPPVVATLIDIAFDAGADEFGLRVIENLMPQSRVVSTGEEQIAIESIVSVWKGVTDNIELATIQAEASLSRLSQHSSPTTEALCLASYGTLLLLSGRIAEAQARFQSALELAAAAGDLRRQVNILNNNGIALLEAGDTTSARNSFERVLTTPNVHSRLRGYGNLAILHYETGDFANAERAADAVLTMNAAYKSPSSAMLARSILGLAAFATGDGTAAAAHAADVKGLIDKIGRVSGDATYPTLLIARLLTHHEHYQEAIETLDRMAREVEARDVLCAMRLECEKADILARVNVDRAFAIVHQIAAEAASKGAFLIERRARAIMDRLH